MGMQDIVLSVVAKAFHCVQNEHHEGEADDVDARAAEVHTVPSGSPVALAAVAASVTPVASSSVSVSGSAGLFLCVRMLHGSLHLYLFRCGSQVRPGRFVRSRSRSRSVRRHAEARFVLCQCCLCTQAHLR